MIELIRTYRYLLALAVAGLAVLSPFRVGIVQGASMDPSLKDGHAYLLQRSDGEPPRRGDVVVFSHRGATYVKRVFAGPGDSFQVLKQTGTDFMEDILLNPWMLPYVRRMTRMPATRASIKLITRRVPPGHYYVVGDHLSASVDSRQFGPVPLECIRGRLLFPPPPSAEVNLLAGTIPPRRG